MAESTSTSKTLDSTTDTTDNIATANVHLPRISIQFCTQCRWMLRAAYVRDYLSFPFRPIIFQVLLLNLFWSGLVFDWLFYIGFS